ncbi:MAG: hypothetical protein ISS57_07100 [Anaerolineales bacterium]|nr:hypothetical protein [Anaerolineales bacterium]
MKYPYTKEYQPSFPMIQIRLSNPEEGLRSESVNALLDTGSDGSLVPIEHLQQILAPVLKDTHIRSHWGEWRSVQLFAVDIELADIKLPALFVVGDDQGDEIILGRDLLNKLRILFDGPSEATTILSEDSLNR